MTQAGLGDLVAVGVRDALDEAVFAEPPQVVGGLTGADRSRPVHWFAEEFGEQVAQVLVGEPGVAPEYEQDVQEGLGVWVGEA
ncbi:hypothetical protein Aple_060470 [Acrocarpospora pleiomorpha]|uniref:Uncharacterized protein n=1 Tax=Acrocarpospora pleiomorpha TaxID=90975 RepID=A0A5M3XXW3_9ACTN|nr:hypothetical protein Aple_060470 [Acrocarpospora pleiomorpha]